MAPTWGESRPDRAVTLRHPTEDDQRGIVAVVDDWFDGRRVRHLVGRSWFRHWGSTSWLAQDPGGAVIGFLLGQHSRDVPDEGVLHLVAVHPSHRRHGIGRALVNAFVNDAADTGATRITAVAWPGEPIALAFFRGIGFRADDGPGTQNLFGTPAYPDYEGGGEDRVVLNRPLGQQG
jgi:ribosomal protein S18 acetylase RimI-like enzyme